ncbi:hypothetical protein [Novilysobacter erysipheiresistens]|uniref:Uncharacterized protein n=1 Tax=Novilysobacter erysipheiresistens TaxID=1749332 RepID=A0ABU7YUN2_9GAMM
MTALHVNDEWVQANDSATVARVRLFGVVGQDREQAPAFRWVKLRARSTLLLYPPTFDRPSYSQWLRGRKAKYRWERRA